MAAITVTKTEVHNSGDQKKVVATVSSLANSNTYEVPHIRNIEDWTFTCTTDDSAGGVVSGGNTITFAAGATIAGTLVVYGR